MATSTSVRRMRVSRPGLGTDMRETLLALKVSWLRYSLSSFASSAARSAASPAFFSYTAM